jgi:hypothetical protein
MKGTSTDLCLGLESPEALLEPILLAELEHETHHILGVDLEIVVHASRAIDM